MLHRNVQGRVPDEHKSTDELFFFGMGVRRARNFKDIYSFFSTSL
jgi:hypothetical protein